MKTKHRRKFVTLIGLTLLLAAIQPARGNEQEEGEPQYWIATATGAYSEIVDSCPGPGQESGSTTHAKAKEKKTRQIIYYRIMCWFQYGEFTNLGEVIHAPSCRPEVGEMQRGDGTTVSIKKAFAFDHQADLVKCTLPNL